MLLVFPLLLDASFCVVTWFIYRATYRSNICFLVASFRLKNFIRYERNQKTENVIIEINKIYSIWYIITYLSICGCLFFICLSKLNFLNWVNLKTQLVWDIDLLYIVIYQYVSWRKDYYDISNIGTCKSKASKWSPFQGYSKDIARPKDV